MISSEDYILFGFVFMIWTGISKFVFDYPIDGFAMSIGIFLAGILILIYNLVKDDD